MDGNGRWAKKRGLPRSLGHSKGAGVFRDIVIYCNELGVKYVTVYAFSTENWKRSRDEIDSIVNILRDYLKKGFIELKKNNIVIKFIGDISPFPQDVKDEIKQLEADSAANNGITLNIALNYGGRAELVHAFRSMLADVEAGKLSAEEITEDTVESYLYTAGQPSPDLIIRPSGELRLSNFMLWQAAYSEFWFDNVLWPDFDRKDLLRAFADFAERDRRYGGRK
ncbi:MAG: isoprenyl transferase [Clostridia bacterium]|nr:isoprenyl transferase [Clostridia bacterium]